MKTERRMLFQNEIPLCIVKLGKRVKLFANRRILWYTEKNGFLRVTYEKRDILSAVVHVGTAYDAGGMCIRRGAVSARTAAEKVGMVLVFRVRRTELGRDVARDLFLHGSERQHPHQESRARSCCAELLVRAADAVCRCGTVIHALLVPGVSHACPARTAEDALRCGMV